MDILKWVLQGISEGRWMFRSTKYTASGCRLPSFQKSFSKEPENTDIVKSTLFLPVATQRHPVKSLAFTKRHFLQRNYSAHSFFKILLALFYNYSLPWRLELLPHNKVLGFNRSLGPFSVEFSFLLVSVWVLSRFSDFLLHSKIMHVRWIGNSELTMFVFADLYVALQ